MRWCMVEWRLHSIVIFFLWLKYHTCNINHDHISVIQVWKLKSSWRNQPYYIISYIDIISHIVRPSQSGRRVILHSKLFANFLSLASVYEWRNVAYRLLWRVFLGIFGFLWAATLLNTCEQMLWNKDFFHWS